MTSEGKKAAECPYCGFEGRPMAGVAARPSKRKVKLCQSCRGQLWPLHEPFGYEDEQAVIRDNAD